MHFDQDNVTNHMQHIDVDDVNETAAFALLSRALMLGHSLSTVRGTFLGFRESLKRHTSNPQQDGGAAKNDSDGTETLSQLKPFNHNRKISNVIVTAENVDETKHISLAAK